MLGWLLGRVRSLRREGESPLGRFSMERKVSAGVGGGLLLIGSTPSPFLGCSVTESNRISSDMPSVSGVGGLNTRGSHISDSSPQLLGESFPIRLGLLDEGSGASSGALVSM